MNSPIIFFFLVLVVAHTMHASPPPPPPSSPPSPISDFALLAVQWPTGLCKASQGTQNPCLRIPGAPKFSLHGMWPTYASGMPKVYCRAPPYNATLLQNLRGDLKIFWPSFFFNADDGFWNYQWQKHGSCSTLSLVDFFQAGITFGKTYFSKLQMLLSKAGVVPSPTKAYRISDYLSAIKSLVVEDEVYVIQCKSKKGSPDKYLVEMRFCIDQKLQNIITCHVLPIDRFPGCGTRNDVAIFYT